MKSTVEFENGLKIEAQYRAEGRFYPASSSVPGERPAPVVERVMVLLGDFRAPAHFDELPETMREMVLDELQTEIDDLGDGV